MTNGPGEEGIDFADSPQGRMYAIMMPSRIKRNIVVAAHGLVELENTELKSFV